MSARWKFERGKKRIVIHAGVVAVRMYFGAIFPRADNCLHDEKWTRICVFFMPLKLIPGQSFNAYGWIKRESLGVPFTDMELVDR